MPSSVEAIAARLRRLREHYDLKQGEFARSIGISETRWNNYETGLRRLTIDVAAKVCDRYSVTLDWLYLGKPGGLPGHLISDPSLARA